MRFTYPFYLYGSSGSSGSSGSFLGLFLGGKDAAGMGGFSLGNGGRSGKVGGSGSVRGAAGTAGTAGAAGGSGTAGGAAGTAGAAGAAGGSLAGAPLAGVPGGVGSLASGVAAGSAGGSAGFGRFLLGVDLPPSYMTPVTCQYRVDWATSNSVARRGRCWVWFWAGSPGSLSSMCDQIQ